MGRLTGLRFTVLALLFAAPAYGQADIPNTRPNFSHDWRPDAVRAPTGREKLSIPSAAIPSQAGFAGSVTREARAAWPCIAVSTDKTGMRIRGALENRCGFALRMRASYGFLRPGGQCQTVGMLNGVLWQGETLRRPFRWSGSDDRTLQACIGTVELFGVPDWLPSSVREATNWMTQDVARQATMVDAMTDGKYAERVRIRRFVFTGTCTGVFETEANNSGSQAGIVHVDWRNVEAVRGVSYNRVLRLMFTGHSRVTDMSVYYGPGHPDASLDWQTAAAILQQYCAVAGR